jgi:hypothetical protein
VGLSHALDKPFAMVADGSMGISFKEKPMGMRMFMLVTAMTTSWCSLHGQDPDPAIELGAAYSRAVAEKEETYHRSFDELSKKLSKMQILSQDSKEETILAMKIVVTGLIAEGKAVIASYEKYKSDSKAYMAALDRIPSAIPPMAEMARLKARKNANNPIGKQYEQFAKNANELIGTISQRRLDVEQGDALIAQAVKETESAVEFLTDYGAFLEVLSLGDITAARQAFRERMHEFMRNYQKFDGLMQKFHEKLRSTSSSDKIRQEYQAEKAKKAEEQELKRIQEQKAAEGRDSERSIITAEKMQATLTPAPSTRMVSQSNYRPVNYANVAKASSNVQRNINTVRRFIK